MAFSYTIGVITILSAFQIASLVPGNSLYSKSLVYRANTNLDNVNCTNNVVYNSNNERLLVNKTMDDPTCDNNNNLDEQFSENGTDFLHFTDDDNEVNIFIPEYAIEKEILSSKMSKRNIVDYITQDNNIVALQNNNKKYDFITNLKYYF